MKEIIIVRHKSYFKLIPLSAAGAGYFCSLINKVYQSTIDNSDYNDIQKICFYSNR